MTSRMKRRQPEKTQQIQIVRLLRTLGAAVWVTGTRRPRGDYPGTRMTPGLPDLFAFLPLRAGGPTRLLLVIECKAKGGRLRLEQAQFAACCREAHLAYVAGNMDDVIGWLTQHGWLSRR